MAFSIDATSYDKTQRHPVEYGYGHRASGARIQAIIVHSTNGAPGSAFAAEAAYLADSPKVSAHFLVGKDGRIVCIVPPSFCAWHSGDCTPNVFENDTSLGIETHFTPGEIWPAAGHDALTWLVKQLIPQYGIPKTNIDTHRHVAVPAGRKIDPSNYSDSQFSAWRDSVFTPTALRTFRVVSTGTINIRQGPSTSYKIAGTLRQGDTAIVDAITPGESIQGNDQWAHLASGLGFVTMTVLAEVKQYKVIAPEARIRAHLMPVKSGDRQPYRGKLLQGALVEGTPFGEWLHIQHEKGSGFIRKELALELVNEEAPDA